MEGTITTIQRMSVHDGAGIRSTLFLKGCGMRCRWCHNPETWSGGVQLQQTAGRCIGCGSCLEACPSSALSLTAEGIRDVLLSHDLGKHLGPPLAVQRLIHGSPPPEKTKILLR